MKNLRRAAAFVCAVLAANALTAVSSAAEDKITDEDIQALAKVLNAKGRYHISNGDKEAYIFFAPGRNFMKEANIF